MHMQDNVSLKDWIASSQSSFWRWPSLISLASVIVLGINMMVEGNDNLHIGPLSIQYFDALCIFTCLMVSSYPIWYIVTARRARKQPRAGNAAQLARFVGLLVIAIVLAPTFSIEYRNYVKSGDDWRDETTTWIKRSIIASVQQPQMVLDEIDWLQSNYSASYIPAGVYCPLRSTRLMPLTGVVHQTYEANALAGREAPPAAVLAATIARCNREGPVMRAAGHTKEAALLRGNVDRFFMLNALEHRPYSYSTNTSVVLEDGDIPPNIMRKMEAQLVKSRESSSEGRDWYGYLDDTDYDTSSGQIRRFKPLLIAVALGRKVDEARLRKYMDN